MIEAGLMGNDTVLFGTIEDLQDYNLDKPMARASLLGDIKELVAKAKNQQPEMMLSLVIGTKGVDVCTVVDDLEIFDMDNLMHTGLLMTEVSCALTRFRSKLANAQQKTR